MQSLDEFAQKVLQGEPLSDILVIDCHAHMDRWFNLNVGHSSPTEMVRWMDRLGIDCCISSHHLSIGPDFREGNRRVFRAVEEFPGRIYGYVVVNPHYPAEDNIAELEKYAAHPGMKGIKMHPETHFYPVNGPRYVPVWKWANEHGTVVLVHTWRGSQYNDPGQFRDLAAEYPNARIILGHTGGSTYEAADQCIELAKEHANLFLDLTGSHQYQGVLEYMVEQFDANRILFGTDLPFLDARPQTGRVAFADISPEAKARIFGLNSAELFGIST